MSVSWKGTYGAITNEAARRGIFELPPRYTSGQALGIIAVDLDYPKVPGNVVNATTYDFPVLYEMVSFEIEQLFAGDPNIKEQVIAAAKKLEAEGVRAIIGACGYFAHFQKDVAAAVGVPVFMSSLCQMATIKTWLPSDRKIAVFAADGASINDEFLANVNTTTEQIVVVNVGDMESFAPIRWGKGPLNNGLLEDDLCTLAKKICEEHPEVDAILLECSDLPPYAAAIQRATGLPVFDFITLAKWVESVVVQRPYYGML